jgi:hypothetical protein
MVPVFHPGGCSPLCLTIRDRRLRIEGNLNFDARASPRQRLGQVECALLAAATGKLLDHGAYPGFAPSSAPDAGDIRTWSGKLIFDRVLIVDIATEQQDGVYRGDPRN